MTLRLVSCDTETRVECNSETGFAYIIKLRLVLHNTKTVLQLLKELSDVEDQLRQKNSNLAGTYTSQLGLCIVAVLRKYQAYLVVSQENTTAVFDGYCPS